MEAVDRKITPRPIQTRSLSQINIGTSGNGTSPYSPSGGQLSPLVDYITSKPTDKKASYNGAKEVVKVVEAIEAKNVACCIVGEAALIYYGARRVMFDWLICVPTEQLDEVRKFLENQPGKYEPFTPSTMNVFGSLIPRYPRFKITGQATFFVLVSSQACHLDVKAQIIEYDRWIRLPYPKLPEYTQSLLDRWMLSDLEDIIDGMNLSTQWGEEHLDLEGTVDQDWACWKETTLAERELTDDELPKWTESRKGIWLKVASDEAKKKRQGWKSRPGQLTRFWMSGQQDPRDRYKDYS